MKILIVVLIIVAAAAATVWWLGSRVPVRHRVSIDLILHQSAESIFGIVVDVANYPSWRKDVKSVETLPAAADGAQRFRENGSNGAITYRVDASESPARFVTRIDDATLPFGGTWTLTIVPEAGGSRVTIVEDGEVKPVFFRFMAHYVFGYHATMKAYLSSLAQRFGETAALREVPDQ
jgi:hypothetical protein